MGLGIGTIGLMALRSHLGRPMDMSLPSNRLIVGLTLVAAAAAGVVVWDGGTTTTFLAPLYAFATWAFLREVDPDHDSTAIAGAFVAALWVLAGFDPSAWLFVGALAVASRLVSNSTGRRPLPGDLIVLTLGAAVISFTAIGWVAGFALALAIYIFDRMDEEHRPARIISSAAAALAASGVATASGVFGEQLPDIDPPMVIAVGGLALLAFLREPEPPTSLVDAQRKTPLVPSRLHVSRGLAGLAVFAATLLSGSDADSMAVPAVALGMMLVSNELERIKRRRV